MLGERVGIVGTPYTLNYRSNRVAGRTASRTIRIPLSGPAIPDSLKRFDLEIHVAGRTFLESVARGTNASTTFTWDGKDAYGRAVQGAQLARIRIGYVYNAV